MSHETREPSPAGYAYLRANYVILPEEGKVISNYTGSSVGSKNDRGYVCVQCNIDGRKWSFKRSHLVWWAYHSVWPKRELDHEDRQPFNDKIGNLAEKTRAEQVQNTYTSLNRELPVGVYKRNDATLRVGWNYIVQIRLKNKTVSLKYFLHDQLDKATALSKLAQDLRRANPDVTKQEIMQQWSKECSIEATTSFGMKTQRCGVSSFTTNCRSRSIQLH